MWVGSNAIRWLLIGTLLVGMADTLTAQIEHTFTAESDPWLEFNTVIITKNDHYVVAAARTGIAAWDLDSKEQVFSHVDRNSRFRNYLYDFAGNRLLYTYGSTLMELAFERAPEAWKVREVVDLQERTPLAVSADGRYMAFKVKFATFGVFDLQQKSDVFQHPVDSKQSSVNYATFSPDNNLTLAFGREEDAVVTYSVPEGKQVSSSASFLSSVSELRFIGNGQYVAVRGSMGGTSCTALLDPIRLRLVRGGRLADVGALAGSADGAYLLIGSTVYDVATKKRLTQLVGRHSYNMSMNRDGSKAVSGAGDASVVLWDWQANLRFRQAKMTLAVPGNEIQYSPDGKFVALAIPKYHQGHVATAVRDARPVVDISTLDGEAAYILLLNASDGKYVKGMVSKIPAFERGTDPFEKDYGYGNFRHLEFSPDGKTLATLYGSGRGDLVLWNIASARPRVNLMIRSEEDTWRTGWTNVKYLKDGKSLLLLGKPEHRDEVVQTFNLDTSDVSATITGRFADSLLLLPGGQFASGFITYDYLNGEVLSTAKELPYQLVRTSGNTLVGRGHIGRSYDGLARWDLDTNKVTHPYTAHSRNAIGVHSLASSPNGHLVASGGADSLIRIWDSATGRLLTNLRGHKGRIDDLCFSPDGTTLASASSDGTARFWDIGDLGSSEAKSEELKLPTRRSFETKSGASVTVVFDRPASKREIGDALRDAAQQVGK